jgi:RNA polymerase sigma-70 factor, ECF subfamily
VAALTPAEFEALLREAWPEVRSAVRRFAAGADAEDLAQEVAVRAWERLEQLGDPALFGAWVVRIALNLGRSVLRRQARVGFCSLHAVQEPTGGDPAPEIAEGDSLARALAALTDAEKRTLSLHAAGLDSREIAARLAEPTGTVRARLSRTRRKLAAELRRQGWTSLGRHAQEEG